MTIRCLEHALYEEPSNNACRQLRGCGAPAERIRLACDIVESDGGDRVLVLTPSPLRGKTANITADAIDIRIVTNRGLLVSDDQSPLTGRYVAFCGHLRHLHRLRRRPHFYRGPLMPYAGAATTTLGGGERKQLFVSVHVGKGTPPGRYEGAIELVADGTITRLPVAIDVAPVVLHEPPQLRMLWYLGTLDCQNPRHTVDEATLRAQLQDIWNHGFTAISLHERNPRLLRRACAIAREIGFSAVVLDAPYPERLAADDLCGLRGICYVSDEPDRRGDAMVAMHRAHMRAAQALGAATFTSLVHEPFARRFVADDLGRRPEMVSLFLPNNRAHMRAHAAFPELRRNATLYYWMANAPDPRTHRTLTGVYLWKSRAAGISPYCYQHLPAYPGSPLDEDRDADGELRQMLTYPASPGAVGCIPTLRWEAMADGITDLRYLVTVTDLLEQAAKRDEPATRELRDEVTAHLATIADACPMGDTAVRTLTASGFEAARAMLTRDAVALEDALACQLDATNDYARAGRSRPAGP